LRVIVTWEIAELPGVLKITGSVLLYIDKRDSRDVL